MTDTLPRIYDEAPDAPVERLLASGPDHLLVLLQGGALSRIELPGGGEHQLAVGAQLSLASSLSRAMGYRDTEIEVFELDAGTRWKLDAPSLPIAPALSADGRSIIYVVNKTLLTSSSRVHGCELRTTGRWCSTPTRSATPRC